MADEIAIKVDHVYKNFVLPHERISSIKGLVTSAGKKRKSEGKTETQHALKDISFEIKKGEFFGIVGRNGSGKSTLLKILAGIYQPSNGKVSTSGKLVPFIELGVGFNPELTGRENVYLNGAMLGFSENEVSAMYDDVVSFAELERFMDQKLKNYSSGMQVRLAFSMATRAKADILLIDEVLAVGDADFQRKCFDYFKELKKRKKTVVFVSHDMGAIREYCDRSMLIEASEVLKLGDTDKVAEHYSRLFNQQASVANEDQPENDNPDRWGNGKAKIEDLKVSVKSGEVLITHRLHALEALDSPINGFRIRDASGKEVTGTNNKIERKNLPSLKPNESIACEWRFPNIFSDGEYIVDLAITQSDNITVVDWWDDAARLRVKKLRHIPYAIDPGFNIAVTSSEN